MRAIVLSYEGRDLFNQELQRKLSDGWEMAGPVMVNTGVLQQNHANGGYLTSKLVALYSVLLTYTPPVEAATPSPLTTDLPPHL